jgi:hypothetical protein
LLLLFTNWRSLILIMVGVDAVVVGGGEWDGGYELVF